ncbi:MAG: ATP-binding protein [Sterolibacterium sp.]|nr:ATP-binding protein [Sterolibacterium sp.]
MFSRQSWQARIRQALQRSRAVALIGPRQIGKTTLARQFVDTTSANYFDLEDPLSLARLAEPMTALKDLRGLVVIDEVQRAPQIFPILRVLVDRPGLPARFMLLGSASPALIRGSSESLAGRVEVIEISGFSLTETGYPALEKLWLRGGFPLSFLAGSDGDSRIWRRQFLQTFAERDLPQLGFNIPAPAVQRFMAMVAHYHGQIWSGADPARSLGISESTVRRYLDMLASAYLVRQLQPWFENLGKRQVRSPKVYVRDSGMLHELLGIADMRALLEQPKCGASWEGFIIEEILRRTEPDEAFFWATHQGAELDLLLFKDGRRIGIEIKRMDAPRLTPSMKIALADLKLDRLFVVYPGDRRYALAENVEVVPARELATPLE